MLVLKTNKHTKVLIGGVVVIAEPLAGGQVRLSIDAPKAVPITRHPINAGVGNGKK